MTRIIIGFNIRDDFHYVLNVCISQRDIKRYNSHLILTVETSKVILIKVEQAKGGIGLHWCVSTWMGDRLSVIFHKYAYYVS